MHESQGWDGRAQLGSLRKPQELFLGQGFGGFNPQQDAGPSRGQKLIWYRDACMKNTLPKGVSLEKLNFIYIFFLFLLPVILSNWPKFLSKVQATQCLQASSTNNIKVLTYPDFASCPTATYQDAMNFISRASSQDGAKRRFFNFIQGAQITSAALVGF